MILLVLVKFILEKNIYQYDLSFLTGKEKSYFGVLK
jgi:hypothetical protein